MTTRVYVLTRLGSGDYLLPSNDGRTLWRISRYDDPEFIGQPHGWQAHRISTHDFQQRTANGWGWQDPLDWEHWEYWGGGYRTRGEAVDEVLTCG